MSRSRRLSPRLVIAIASTGIVSASVGDGVAHCRTVTGGEQESTTKLRSILTETLREFRNPAALLRAANVERKWSDGEPLMLNCLMHAAERHRDAGEETIAESIESTLPKEFRNLQRFRHDLGFETDVCHDLILSVFRPTDETMPPAPILDYQNESSMMGPISRTWPIVLVDHVPFNFFGVEFHVLPKEAHSPGGHLVLFSDFFDYVAWARLHARSRSGRLVPPDDPFQSVDAYLARARESNFFNGLIDDAGFKLMTRLLRGQVLRMLEGILDSAVEKDLQDFHGDLADDDDLTVLWNVFAPAARIHELHWNPDDGRYELRAK